MGILKEVQKTISVNAGHHDLDTGQVVIADNGIDVKENEQVKKIRDLVVPMLEKCGFRVIWVPDNLNLDKSIELTNKEIPTLNAGLAIDIHLNARGPAQLGAEVRGTEVYSGTSPNSRTIANTISKYVSRALDTVDRGYRPDTVSAVGSLGWIRLTKCWAVVIECCYLDNQYDRNVLFKGYESIALGITKAICELFETPFHPSLIKNDWKPIPVQPPREIDRNLIFILQEKILKMSFLLVDLLQKLIILKQSKHNPVIGKMYKLFGVK